MKLSKVWLFSSLMVLVLVAGAAAQDDTWKGVYIGGYAGAGIGHANADLTTEFSPTGYFATTSPPAIAALSPQHPESTNFTGGFQAGFNLQHGHLVAGLEADIGSLDRSNTVTASGTYPCCAPTGFTVTQTVSTGWLATVRPRVGYAHGNALFFVTGGLAITDLKYQGHFTDTFATANEFASLAENKAGWVFGGGLQYKVSKHWSLRGEFLHANFGQLRSRNTDLTAFSPPIAFPTNPFLHRADASADMVRFGFNWHF